jgi:NAD+ synthase
MKRQIDEMMIIRDFISTYFKNSGCKGIVLGLSGGVDSAVTALLCQEAIGKEKVFCLFLPDETTPETDYIHHQILVKEFDLQSKIIDINNLVKDVGNTCALPPTPFAQANIKARLRMILLFEYANMTNSLVCGTSNKSEILIGYFTKYGDGAVDIMPIGDLYKTQVWKIAKHLNIPKEIIEKPPTAGLLKNQTDEQEIKMNYQNLDKILIGLEEKWEIDHIAKKTGIPQKDIQRIKKMRIASQHKRRAPLIPKIGLRTPGLDWRSPILEG